LRTSILIEVWQSLFGNVKTKSLRVPILIGTWQSRLSDMNKQGFVYILTNKRNKVLYTGVSSGLVGRVFEHKAGIGSDFTSKYKANKLVYYEVADDIQVAIAREKQIKSWKRQKKIDLINRFNSEWRDLSSEI